MTRGLLALPCAILVACGGPPAEPRYPGHLVPTSELSGPDFSVRQRIDGRSGDRTWSLEAVLQKRDDVLLLLGLTPFGSRAFAIEQRGIEVTFTSFVEEELAFPPRFVLLDVHRTLFLGIGPGPSPDGEHRRTSHGERIRETWRDGRLMTRVFERVDGDPAGTIVIEYEGGKAPGEVPAAVRLDNGWLGYEIRITRLE